MQPVSLTKPSPIDIASTATMPATNDLPDLSRSRAMILLLIILTAGLSVRFYQIDRQSFWLDEMLSLAWSAGWMDFTSPRDVLLDPPPDFISLKSAKSLVATWSNCAEDTNPPLYFILLRLWRMAFGDSDWWLRGLSALTSVGAIAAMYFAVRYWTNFRTAGLWAAALLSVSGVHIQYAQECRSYGPLTFVLLSTAAFLACLERRGPTKVNTIGLGVATLLSLLVHYTAVGAIGALMVYCVVMLRGRVRRNALWAFAGAWIAYAVVWGPFVAVRMRPAVATRVSFTLDPQGGHFLTTLDRLAHLPLRSLVLAPHESTAQFYGFALVLLVPAIAFGFTRRRDLAPWIFLFAGTAGLIAVNDYVGSRMALEYSRYTLASVPPIVAIAATLAWSRRRDRFAMWARHGVPAILLVGSAASLPAVYDLSKIDWRGAAATLDAGMQPGDVLVCTPGDEDWKAGAFYLGLDHYSRTLPRPVVFLSKPPSAAMLDILNRAPHVWTVTPGLSGPPGRFLPGYTVRQWDLFLGTGAISKFERLPPASRPSNQPLPQ